MKATPEYTEKTSVRYVVQWFAKGRWLTHDAGFINDSPAPGVYRSREQAKWHYDLEAPHRAPGTLRLIKSTVVSSWEVL
jgi:hypothetical protein